MNSRMVFTYAIVAFTIAECVCWYLFWRSVFQPVEEVPDTETEPVPDDEYKIADFRREIAAWEREQWQS